MRGYAAPEVGPVFQRAREICEKIGEPQQQFAVLFGNFAWRVVRGEMGLSMTLAREAMSLAEQLDDPGVWMEALFLLGVTLFYRGDFVGAREQYERALSQYDDRELTRGLGFARGRRCGRDPPLLSGIDAVAPGIPGSSAKVNREMLELARSIEHPYSLAYAQHHSSWLYHHLRLPEETLASSDEGIRTSAEHGFPLFHATGALYAGAGLLLQKRTEMALPELMRGFDAYRATGAALALPYYLGLLGDALTQTGTHSEAKSVLGSALAVAERSDERCQEAELYRLEGELAWSEGKEPIEIEAIFLRAIDTARKQNSKAWELRATTSLARLYQGQNRRDQAQAILGQALGGFTEGFGTPDLRDARTLLEELRAD